MKTDKSYVAQDHFWTPQDPNKNPKSADPVKRSSVWELSQGPGINNIYYCFVLPQYTKITEFMKCSNSGFFSLPAAFPRLTVSS